MKSQYEFWYKGLLCTVFQPDAKNDPNWYEYTVASLSLEKYDGLFNSLNETYNGATLQRLDKKSATYWAMDFVDELLEEENG
jgi:hypothetical protein